MMTGVASDAIHDHQTVAFPLASIVCRSYSCRVAPANVPVKLTELPWSTILLAKSSLTGAAPKAAEAPNRTTRRKSDNTTTCEQLECHVRARLTPPRSARNRTSQVGSPV